MNGELSVTINKTNISEYIAEKLELLNQFKIKLRKEESEHLQGLNSEPAIDRFMRGLFNKYL